MTPGADGDRLLALLIDESPDALILASADGTIVHANKRVEALFGWRADELIGQSVETLIPERLRDMHRGHRSAFDHDQKARPMGQGAVLSGSHRNGSRVPVDVSLSPFVHNEQSYVLAAVRNAQVRLEAERTRKELDEVHAALSLAEERDRIARDLHDGVIQQLYGAGLHLQALRCPAEEQPRLDAVIDGIDAAITDIRSTVFALHSPRGLDHGFSYAIRQTVAEASRILHHQPTLTLSGAIDEVPTDLASEAIDVVRELLVNVAKHAQAESSSLSINASTDGIAITVADSGVGIDVADIRPGQGLHNLRDRAERRSGSFSIDRAPDGSGSTALWQVPIPASN